MTDTVKFNNAVERAVERQRGLHGSVGTQNEKLIHAALKNYYCEFSDEQEIRIGDYFADAVNENGIFEIQTRGLYRLKEKLNAFLEFSRVTVVYPLPCVLGTVYINSDNGEIEKKVRPRNLGSIVEFFEELYSIREFLNNDRLRIILARLNIQKRVYFQEIIPNLRNKSERKKCVIEKVPLELREEIILENKSDYLRFLPEKLPEEFSKKELAAAAKETSSSKRLEVLRTLGLIVKTGKRGNSYLYKRR